ncbi:MAG: hypothetical protein IH582_16520 [Afipia sp.]|nr:hypothetical protein [Afipia sp.]
MNFTTTRRLSFGIGLISLLSGGPLLADEELSLSFLDKNNFYLSSAGFKVQLANGPKGEKALHALPPHRFVIHTVNGVARYLFADPKRCVCIFVGNKDNYLSYRSILSQPLGAAPNNVEADYKTNALTMLNAPLGGNDIYDPDSLSEFLQDYY